MWLSQELQGLTSALYPVYSLSSFLASPAAGMANVYSTERITIQTAYSSNLFGIRAVASRYASFLGLG